jgi:hypothetical protein
MATAVPRYGYGQNTQSPQSPFYSGDGSGQTTMPVGPQYPGSQPINYPGGNPNFNEQTGQYGTPPASQPSTGQTGSTGTPAQPVDAGASNPLYQGINPQLVQYFQQNGITPTGRGTGPTDIAYLNDQMTAPGQDPGYWLNTKLPSIFSGAGGGSPSANALGAQAGALGGFTFGPSGLNFGPSPSVGAAPQGAAGSLYSNELAQLAQNEQPVTADDPIIKAQTDAFRAEQDRSTKSALSAAAEGSGSSANLAPYAASMAEKGGQATSNYQSQLMGQEIQNRRNQIMSLLQTSGNLLSSQDQMALQDELAKLGLAEQEYQFRTGTGLNESQFGRTLAEQGLEFGAGLDARYAGV